MARYRSRNHRPRRGKRGRRSKTPFALYAGIAVLLLALLSSAGYWWANQPNNPTEVIIVPTLDPSETERKLLSVLQRWTDTETVGIDCVASVCNQTVVLGLTLLTPEVLASMARYDAVGSSDPTAIIAQKQVQLEERLKTKTELPFVLTVTFGDQTQSFVSSNSLNFGDLQQQLTLYSDAAESFRPQRSDQSLSLPLSLTPRTSQRGYIYFPRQTLEGADVLEKSASITVQLVLSEDIYTPTDSVVWNFDLLANPDPPPLTPTLTPDPNRPTPETTAWSDPDVWVTIAEMVIELAR